MSARPFANRTWFPLGALYSALILPWSVAAQSGWLAAPPGLQSGWGHGHEMLFGFALAVVAGYLLGPQSQRRTLLLVTLWLGARVAFLGWPQSVIAGLLNAGFVGALAWEVVPVFLKTAKKWRNRSVAVVVIGLVTSVVAFHAGVLDGVHLMLARNMLLEAILLLSVLMFFMGGRILAPAIAGHMQSKQLRLEARVQPNVEAAVLLLIGAALCINVLPLVFRDEVLGLLLLACAGLAAVRMLRWQPWQCRERLDLLLPLVGYGWLVAGWALIGWSLLGRTMPLSIALHAITVGALGTLSISVMLRTRMIRVLKGPNARPLVYLLALPVSLAALSRLFVTGLSLDAALLLAAAIWSAAFLGLFGVLLWLERKEAKR